MINSLDEAIKHCEEVADGLEETAQEIAMQDENGVHQPRVSWYQDRASSQRQIAEWLRELKKWRALRDSINMLCDVDCEYPQYKERGTMCDACPIGTVKDYFEQVFDEEVKADEPMGE